MILLIFFTAVILQLLKLPVAVTGIKRRFNREFPKKDITPPQRSGKIVSYFVRSSLLASVRTNRPCCTWCNLFCYTSSCTLPASIYLRIIGYLRDLFAEKSNFCGSYQITKGLQQTLLQAVKIKKLNMASPDRHITHLLKEQFLRI